MSGPEGHFSSIPTLDLHQVQADRQQFLAHLRHAATFVGFLYLKGTEAWLPAELVDKMKGLVHGFFYLPAARKLAIQMDREPVFMGYNPVGYEVTKGRVDNREQVDFSVDREPINFRDGVDPDYLRGVGPSQWPEEGEEIPGFREATTEYIRRLTALSHELTDLLAEALGFDPRLLDRYFDDRSREGGRIKMIRYPPASQLDPKDGDQGVGPHKDGWLTFLLQVSDDVPGLEVQNQRGEWIPVPPVPGTFVVNFGFYLEKVTHGAVIATTHRVKTPAGDKPRLSLPFFQELSLEAVLDPIPEEQLPKELMDSIKQRGQARTDAATDQFPFANWGESWLYNRVKSHPDVGLRHYPALYTRIFSSPPPPDTGAIEPAPLSASGSD